MSKFQVNLGEYLTMSYRPARLFSNSQGWYIEYATLSNESSKFKRHRVRLNRLMRQCSSMVDFRVKAEAMVASINSQLHGHYDAMQTVPSVATYVQQAALARQMQMQQAALQTALLERQQVEQPAAIPTVSEPTQTNKRAATPINDMLKEFIKDKSAELKKTTMVSYSTFCNQLSDWLTKHYPTLRSGDFNKELAIEYLEFVNMGGNSNGKKVVRKKLNEKRISPRTYNNNLKMGRAVFNWAMDRCYVNDNPFASIKKKRENEKTRTIIPAEDRTKIYNYFQEKNPSMCLVMQLVFTSLIRPIEITRLQVGDIDFANHCIHIPCEKTKNGKSRDARIDEHLEQLLLKHTEHAAMSDYLFANKTWKCGRKAMSSHTFGNVWIVMREELKMPKEYQLYSLRDSSINNMLENGIPALDVMQAAGHSDLSMTTRYGNHKNPHLISKLNNAAPSMIIGDDKGK